MIRWVRILVIFLLGFGVSIFAQYALRFRSFPGTGILPEVTREATPTATIRASVETMTVKRVIDGDTIELADGQRVRYIGIDTPETVHPQKSVECFGVEAKEENRRLVEGKTVQLEKDVSETDQYGRLLRYVYVDSVMINDVLVRRGFAYAVTFPPDVKYQEQFRQAQIEARENNRGLWAGCSLGTINTPSPIPATTRSNESNKDCAIKGNISASDERIYHMPGCGSYDKTVIDETAQERWFCTEEEARAAGWRKAKNCP